MMVIWFTPWTSHATSFDFPIGIAAAYLLRVLCASELTTRFGSTIFCMAAYILFVSFSPTDATSFVRAFLLGALLFEATASLWSQVLVKKQT
jgi:hypothetical protein